MVKNWKFCSILCDTLFWIERIEWWFRHIKDTTTICKKQGKSRFFRKRLFFLLFWVKIRQTDARLNVGYASIIYKYSSEVRKLTMIRNSSVKVSPEVNEGKLPIFFSEDSSHHTGCWLSIFVLFIMTGITWQNDYKNLPVVSWSFFCELLLYVTYDTLNESLESSDLKNNHFEANWWSDRRSELICQ